MAISLGWYPEVVSSPSDTQGLHTRCMLDSDGHTRHIGRGLPEFEYQRWEWFSGDRRTYQTTRNDDMAWELP